MKSFMSFVYSILTAFIVGLGISLFVPVNPLGVVGVYFILRTLYLFLSKPVKNALFAGVNKEIWIDKLKENFYAGYEWLNGVEDWSEWVENNTINFTTIGADPVILKNNSSWPIVAAQRTDTNSTVVLDTYDSTTTRVRNVEEIEAVINKLESAVKQHRSGLMQEIQKECLFNYTPATAAAGNFAATGANRSAVIGSQTTVASTLAIKDIARAQQQLDNLDAPQEGRVIVLSPYHREDLLAQDVSLQKQFADLKTGQALDLYGFKIYVSSSTPLFTKSTLAVKAYGAAADNTNDCIGSIVFIQSEVMKCMGDVEMFHRLKETNPEQRADEIGFQMRFKGAKQRATNFMQMGIVSNRA
jgi:hypothetical protein